ncbi:hypothetical protein BJX63DRAFT_413044 [Aspergillus granulosus]|uniref:Uncharacterized protein n=1 Tax=Aspergillus granulosus TaxID=176169 RepID=A0ABR4GX16_9EURO
MHHNRRRRFFSWLRRRSFCCSQDIYRGTFQKHYQVPHRQLAGGRARHDPHLGPRSGNLTRPSGGPGPRPATLTLP